MTLPITGVFCAAATPIHRDLSVNLPAFTDHCRWLLDQGCDGIALLGTTGEANSFSSAERRTILESALAAGLKPDQLLPGTGLANIPETVELTRHAVDLGVRAVVLLPPFYYKGMSDEGLYDAYARVIGGVADPRLRIILYHIPQVSGLPITHDLIARLRASFGETIAGIKESAGDFDNMTAMIDRFPGFSVFCGADPLLLPLTERGGAGCITATSNLVARDLATVFRWANDPTHATEVETAQARIVAWRTLSNSYSQMPTIKTMIGLLHGDMGWARVRPPLVALTEPERAAIREKLAAIGEIF